MGGGKDTLVFDHLGSVLLLLGGHGGLLLGNPAIEHDLCLANALAKNLKLGKILFHFSCKAEMYYFV